MADKYIELALDNLKKLMNECETDSEISKVSGAMAMLCIKTIHGIEGQQFKEDFLNAALADKEMIKPLRVRIQ